MVPVLMIDRRGIVSVCLNHETELSEYSAPIPSPLTIVLICHTMCILGNTLIQDCLYKTPQFCHGAIKLDLI